MECGLAKARGSCLAEAAQSLAQKQPAQIQDWPPGQSRLGNKKLRLS